ncbi:transketolase [Helicobacter monodelphidis]|uniref:transketolase n=1 Tax=Helicobacter sp. 15-1451 TaxID=2004995 RepID=UPI000DCEBB3C|nr:transketolase [Helicobacter sp. 15-1451]RAX58408.1 transketolase [Helicobacter sp. 15-1451]
MSLSVVLTQEDIPVIQRMANCIRFLSADIVQNAKSGHPGVAMGLAEVMSVLTLHLQLSPQNPKWLNRDRLVFSGGHASALIYSLLHLWGFNLPLEELKAFRQLDSLTPGHPEYGITDGIEITTGPLGQGLANAIGFAMARQYAASLLNEEQEIINHDIYCLCGDGDLEEGISYEACSLAGHLNLSSLIVIYDSNRITIEGDSSISLSENITQRFESQRWAVFECDGHDPIAINTAINAAKIANKPSLIIAHTTIAKGSKNLSGSAKTHGAPLGAEEIAASKEASGFCCANDSFYIPEDVLWKFRVLQDMGNALENQWNLKLKKMSQAKKDLFHQLIYPDFNAITFPQFNEGEMLATRSSNGQILNAIAKTIPGFLGGSADLAPSNNTHIQGEADFPLGRNLHFGIREHAMGAITNGLANYGLFLPYCATFFVFSDYLAPSVRIAALMRAKCYYIWTHDSIGVGEDGATHQPIEQLSHFRAMPNLYTFRPADAHENVAAWRVALNLNSPAAFILTRQNLPVMEKCLVENVQKGGYILRGDVNPKIVLVSSGSEVSLSLEVAHLLEQNSIAVQVVSVPCFELLLEEIHRDREYKELLFPNHSLVVAIEASRGLEWYAFADILFGMESFGESAPATDLFKHFGFEASNIVEKLLPLVNNE